MVRSRICRIMRIVRIRLVWLVGCFGVLAPFRLWGERQDFPPGADLPARQGRTFSTSLSAYGRLGYATFDPYFFVYSVRQRRTCARARAVPVVQRSIMVRWSGLTEPCRLRPVAIWKLTGLAVEVKSCLFGDWMKQLFCLDGIRIYVLAADGQGGICQKLDLRDWADFQDWGLAVQADGWRVSRWTGLLLRAGPAGLRWRGQSRWGP